MYEVVLGIEADRSQNILGEIGIEESDDELDDDFGEVSNSIGSSGGGRCKVRKFRRERKITRAIS